MASAAAVGANLPYEEPVNDIGEDAGRSGEITSAIGSKEDGIAAGEFVDEEDDVRTTSRRKPAANGELPGEDVGVEDDDLFGDDEDAEKSAAPRQLDDEELDSGDDVARTDRVGDEVPATQEQQEYEERAQIVEDIQLPRQPLPEPSDGEMYVLRVPEFMAVEPHAWNHITFQPPTTDHQSSKASASFSAYNTALSTLRWRHSPSNGMELQSNARILRWSDGTLTLQLASQPTLQYDIDANPLAPPQRNALKPTPTSISAPSTKGGRQGDGTIAGEKYDSSKDAFTYLVLPDANTKTLRVVQKVTAGLSVRQPESGEDDAISRLQAALASAANATKVGHAEGLAMTEEDPEAKRRQEEVSVRQIEREKKKRENAQLRAAERNSAVLGRAGVGRSYGLNAGMLEDEEGGGAAPRRKAGAGAKRQSRQRRNSIYSEDEDFGRKHFVSKEDEYDEEDDFLARSDEEEEVSEEEDPDDGIVEDERPARRERTPKRDRGGGDEDADAEGEVDEEVVAVPKAKRRRVVDEDEDEE